MALAADEYVPFPRRIIHRPNRDYDTTGLNYSADPLVERESYYPGNINVWTAFIRLRCAERMRDEVVPHQRGGGLHKWIERYSDYNLVRNTPFRYVKKIPYGTLEHWYYQISLKPVALCELKKKLDLLPRQIRRIRSRLEPLGKVRYGTCPFAEQLVVAKRARLCLRSANHGITWCTEEINRILSTSWIWSIARHYVSRHEGRAWASRGVIDRRYAQKIKVCTYIVRI